MGPGGISTSVSARRRAAMKSRLSIIAKVRALRLAIEPERGRHGPLVWVSKWSAARSRISLEDVATVDERRALGQQLLELDRADLGAVLVALAALLGLLVVVEAPGDTLAAAVEEVDGRTTAPPRRSGSRRVSVKVETKASKTCRPGRSWITCSSGRGRMSRSSADRAVAEKLEVVEERAGSGLGVVAVRSRYRRVNVSSWRSASGLAATPIAACDGDEDSEADRTRTAEAKPSAAAAQRRTAVGTAILFLAE